MSALLFFQGQTSTYWQDHFIKNLKPALAGVAQWIEHGLGTKGLPVQFQVRTYAWVAGQVPSRGHTRGNHTLIFISLSFSFPCPLSKKLINKIFLKNLKSPKWFLSYKNLKMYNLG